MIIDQLPSVGTPSLSDETVTEQGQNLFKVTWQRLLTLFKANTTPADIGAVDSAGAAAAAPVQSVNGMTGEVTIPSAPLSDDNPQPLGTATPGTSTNVSRADHVHAMPTADEVGAMSKWTLLWENASPNSAFAPQTISLALSGYDACAILFNSPRKTYDADSPITAIFLKGIKGLACINSYQLWYRAATMQDTGVVFNAGYQFSTLNQPPTLQNEVMVPTHIYGIKGVG